MTAFHRLLHDGAGYDLTAAAPGVTVLAVRDADGDESHPAFDREQARRFLEDFALVAGLTPTPPVLGRAAALAGTVRILFAQLRELEKTEPVAVEALLSAIVEHVRSWRPVALLAGGVL